MTEASPELSHDDWYDGSLKLWQPLKGLRATTDAVLLAAAVPEQAASALELGAGTGAASLALARRLAHVRITAVEKDPLLAGLLARNIEENGFAERLGAVEADIFDGDSNRAWRGQFDHVFLNPPYNDAASSISGDALRRGAMAEADLARWVDLAAACLRPKGRVVLISRSDRLPEILTGLEGAGVGEAATLPVHSLAGQPAIRVLLTARKGIEGPMALLPPLILSAKGGEPTPEMRAISHDRASIDMTHPARPQSRPGLKTGGDASRKKA